MKKLFYSLLILASAFTASAEAPLKWHSAEALPLFGKAIDDNASVRRYQRLPDSLANQVKRPYLYHLGKHSAGMFVRFATNSPYISAKWHSMEKGLMNHQTPTGTRGLDLYTLMPDGSWRFVNSARPNVNEFDTETRIISRMKPEMREYMLYLSLYDGVDSLYIGTAEDAVFLQPQVALPVKEKPIVMYGTSILQGGCANRPGMAHTNILARRLNREVINLGFSGNGQLDLEVAKVIAAVPDPGLIVMDCVPNVNNEQIDTLLVPFFEIIRSAHPDVPFLFCEDPNFPHCFIDVVADQEVKGLNANWKKHYEKLAAKYGNLHYLPNDNYIGTDGEATVDGLHFTDLGFLRYADYLEPVIRRIALSTTEKTTQATTPAEPKTKPAKKKNKKK